MWIRFAILVLFPGWMLAEENSVTSGGARLVIAPGPAGAGYYLVFEHAGRSMQTYVPGKPLSLEVNGQRMDGTYAKVANENGVLVCQGDITSGSGTHFHFTDRYLAGKPDSFELRRVVTIRDASPNDRYFNTLFGIEAESKSKLQDHDYFVPGIWYRTNFKSAMRGALATHPDDHYFLFRGDRLPLPLAMMRNKADGQTVSLLHVESSEPTTISGDRGADRVVDERMQFGSIGVRQLDGTSLAFMFPGSEGDRNHVDRSASDQWALRSHPVKPGIAHHYKLVIRFSQTASYADAVGSTWQHGFRIYQPKLRPVDVKTAYRGLIDTLDHYAVGTKDGYDAPGFPFSVHLPGGDVRAYNYQMGFIGRQLPNAWILMREGITQRRTDLRTTGESIVDFWAANCLLPSGLPRTWYDPAKDSNAKGTWRDGDNPRGGTAVRVATTGMEGMLNAWRLMKQANIEKPAWLACCRKFGDWLVENQNDDGSYYLAYDHRLTDTRHLPTERSKFTTTNPIRFLVMLHRSTGDNRYRQAAISAGNFALKNIHEPYHYAGSVIDNPNLIDRESGQEALSAFLALHDLTGEKQWLNAAVQAGRYAETWMYAHEVPSEIDTSPEGYPKDRSIIGQTLIASGQSAADLGFAFSSFDYYRLYLFTGDPHFLVIAKLLVHNTKQSLNWDGTLYPGKPRGLQLEAFSVTIPRRRGVMECLSWNYTAHLDPLVRLDDAFGSMEIETIEKLPLDKRRELNRNVLR